MLLSGLASYPGCATLGPCSHLSCDHAVSLNVTHIMVTDDFLLVDGHGDYIDLNQSYWADTGLPDPIFS